MTYQEIQKEKESKISQLIKDCRMFFAFSAEQFHENKTGLQEGEKYLSLGAGAYLPKFQLYNWEKGIKNIENWKKQEVKRGKLNEQEILYELSNHEVFYSWDFNTVNEIFADKYTPEQIKKVFKKYQKQYQECL